MRVDELRNKYLEFFKRKGHAIISSASLVPEHDPTVLFTTAGMHPLVPYLLGEKHPSGKRLVNYQKCVRTDDIDEVGDAWHLTFFEMLGNWSLGDYWKKEAIEWSWEFLTNKKWLGLEPDKIFVTVFIGDKDAPADQETAKLWQKVGLAKTRIFYLPKKDNWWGPVGQSGPCGPDTEMFYDTGKAKCTNQCQPGCNCGKYAEIWNDVFMEYNKTTKGKYELLKQKNVDTGMGLERTIAVINNKDSVYETEMFLPIMNALSSGNIKSKRIITDHIKAATFIIADGVMPSNLERGYVLRRLIRRAIRHGKILRLGKNFLIGLSQKVIKMYQDIYPELKAKENDILVVLQNEEEKFLKTLQQGMKIFEKIAEQKKDISGNEAFHLYDTYGFPLELTCELAKEQNLKVDSKGFERAFEKHQEISRAGAAKRFKSGLADHQKETIKLHTATHLLLQALKDVLGPEVKQMGSNITAERLRFDFNWPCKMTDEQINKVQEIVNQKIKENLLVKKTFKGETSFYSIGDYSKERCAGPHVQHIGQLGTFKIIKEQSSSAGIRRIKVILLS